MTKLWILLLGTAGAFVALVGLVVIVTISVVWGLIILLAGLGGAYGCQQLRRRSATSV